MVVAKGCASDWLRLPLAFFAAPVALLAVQLVFTTQDCMHCHPLYRESDSDFLVVPAGMR